MEIQSWLNHYVEMILKNFEGRIVTIGIQGSYAREEATANSDIDVVVIFDHLSQEDLKKYDQVISKMPYREKICGFLSGKDELICWEKSDLFQFYHDTQCLYGHLDFIASLIKKEDVKKAILLQACNIYHLCCHNMIHEKQLAILQGLYKQAIFVLQAKYFFEKGDYIGKKKDLLKRLKGVDLSILETSFKVKSLLDISSDDFEADSVLLWTWADDLIKTYA